MNATYSIHTTMNNLLDKLNDTSTRPENTAEVPVCTETTPTSGTRCCVAQLHPATVSPAGPNAVLSHQGARILTSQEIEAWRDPGYYIS